MQQSDTETMRPKTQSDEPRPTPATGPKAKPNTSKQTEYVLQVYSFRTNSKAEESARYLKGLNFPSFVVHQEGRDEDRGWFVVYLGPFGDQDTAQRAGSELRAATGSPSVMRERIPTVTQED